MTKKALKTKAAKEAENDPIEVENIFNDLEAADIETEAENDPKEAETEAESIYLLLHSDTDNSQYKKQPKLNPELLRGGSSKSPCKLIKMLLAEEVFTDEGLSQFFSGFKDRKTIYFYQNAFIQTVKTILYADCLNERGAGNRKRTLYNYANKIRQPDQYAEAFARAAFWDNTKMITDRAAAKLREGKNPKQYTEAAEQLKQIYKFTILDIERLRFFVTQCQYNNAEWPATYRRQLYFYSSEKGNGKTTAAQMIIHIINGVADYDTFNKQRGAYNSDLPTELAYSHKIPITTMYKGAVLDEAVFKDMRNAEGNLKTALTDDTARIDEKFRTPKIVPVLRNYIFTSNRAIDSVVCGEDERRFFIIDWPSRKNVDNYADNMPELFAIWFKFIRNAEKADNLDVWYKDTAQDIEGAEAVEINDFLPYIFNDDFVTYVRNLKDKNKFYPTKDVFCYLNEMYHLNKFSKETIKRTFLRIWGEPKRTSNGSMYYYKNDIIDRINGEMNKEAAADGFGNAATTNPAKSKVNDYSEFARETPADNDIKDNDDDFEFPY